jgi:hypothetical protein
MKIVTNKAIMLCKTKEFENEQVIEREMNMVTNKAIMLLKKKGLGKRAKPNKPDFLAGKAQPLGFEQLATQRATLQLSTQAFSAFLKSLIAPHFSASHVS